MTICEFSDAPDRQSMNRGTRLSTTALRLAGCALLAALFSPPLARGQVTLDVAKITCEQFVLYKVANPDYIALWISGYYNGKRDNTMIDIEALKADVGKVRDYCRQNFTVTVMQAVQTVLGAGK